MTVYGYGVYRFGHAVALGDDGSRELLDTLDDIHGQRSRTAGYHLERGNVILLILLVGGDKLHPQRNGRPNGGTVFLDGPEYLVKAFSEEYRAAHGEVYDDALTEAEGVRHAQCYDDHVVFIVIVV